jgi:hypothetical protein
VRHGSFGDDGKWVRIAGWVVGMTGRDENFQEVGRGRNNFLWLSDREDWLRYSSCEKC